MAKENLSDEEKKEKWRKREKQLGIICAIGFLFLFGTIIVRDIKCKQDEKVRLSENRSKYYVSAYKDKNREDVSQEFFGEMFLTADKWQSLSSEVSDGLVNLAIDNEGDLNLGASMYNGLTYSEIECSCSFEEDMSLYAEYLSSMSKVLWDSGENKDISLRLFDTDGNQLSIWCDEDKKYLDYYFTSPELEKSWESAKTLSGISEFNFVEYKEIVLTDELVDEKLSEHGSIIPYVTDLLIDAYNDKEPIKVVLNSEKYLGYKYLSEGEQNSIIDETYNESLTSGDESIPEVGNSAEDSFNSIEYESEKNEQVQFTAIEDLDFNTEVDVILSPEDYIEYSSIVEEKDLNYNPHILLGEIQNKEIEEIVDSRSWVCLFGNNRLFRDISYISNNLSSSDISYQLMYYLYQNSISSYDLSIGIEEIIKNFS